MTGQTSLDEEAGQEWVYPLDGNRAVVGEVGVGLDLSYITISDIS